ncbi:MAG: hypothetical protein MI866_09605 [Bacteroidales bacterium]|nr:hypothetical protein [Bacteroidales bacterium]
MKKLLFTLAIIISSQLVSQAQSSMNMDNLPPAEERADMQTEMMKEKLHLTDEQVPQVKAINLKAAEAMDEVALLNDRMQKFKAFRSSQQEKDEALKKVLTKDQYKLYQASKEEMKKKLKEHRQSKN